MENIFHSKISESCLFKGKNLATCFHNEVKAEKMVTLKHSIKFVLHNKKINSLKFFKEGAVVATGLTFVLAIF